MVLAALGAAGMHQRNFSLFLGAVVGVSVLIVVVFVATTVEGGLDGPPRNSPRD